MAAEWEPLYKQLEAFSKISSNLRFFDHRFLGREDGNRELDGAVNVIIGNLAAFRALLYSKAKDKSPKDHAGWDFAFWCKENQSSVADARLSKNLTDQQIPTELTQFPFDDFAHITTTEISRAREILDFVISKQFELVLAELLTIQKEIDITKLEQT